MQQYDTVIVGAGPAGLECAKILAEAGQQVLVLDKNSDAINNDSNIGQKTCAGGITEKVFDLIPDSVYEISFKNVYVSVKDRKTKYSMQSPKIITIDRVKYSQYLIDNAKEAGVEIRTETRVSEIKEASVIADGKEIAFKHLVGADGSLSIVRKYLGLKTEKKGIAFHYLVNESFSDLEFFLDADLFSTGYAWIFPHNEFTSIGAYADIKDMSSGILKKNFHKWLNKKEIVISEAQFYAAQVPYDYKGHEFNNIYLAGDAAGLASGLTAEGIYAAIISGKDIAALILDKEYRTEGIDNLLKAKKTQECFLNLFRHSGPLKNIGYNALISLSKSSITKKALANILK
ncbi:MAG: NAD(P)/FAD-dependent oxidoreductase [Candidatus Aenigmarchaeota archaeon]|nr:NAD(P)/FAD-dependent oxidoreductase [Candidatus Aenigmarchaeota archaeon]